jgi:hypothetical protein
MRDRDSASERIVQLEQRVADLKARLPKHSTPPAMLIALEDLEAELAQRSPAGWTPEV